MSQRINITYSIKIENLELEVKRLLTLALDKLEDEHSNNPPLEDRGTLLDIETFKDIDDLRQGLTEVDASLGDINNLISSYLNYEAQQLRSAPLSADGSPHVELNELESQLTQFKQQWELSAAANGEDSNEVAD